MSIGTGPGSPAPAGTLSFPSTPIGVTGILGVTFPPSNSGGVNPVGITGLVGITGPISATMLNFPLGFGASITNQGFTVLNFPAVFGVTGQLGVSLSNTGLGVTFPFFPVGVTGQLGVSVSNTGLGVTFPVLSVTFPIGFGVTFNNGVTFLQQQAFGITGGVGLTGLLLASLGYTLGKTNVFKFSQVTTGASAAIFLATFMPAAGTNFYLMGYYFDGSYASASAGVGWLGNVGIQSQTAGSGTTLMVHRVINPGAGIAQVNIEFIEPPFFGNSTIFAIGVIPSQTNLITWTGNFWGYQK